MIRLYTIFFAVVFICISGCMAKVATLPPGESKFPGSEAEKSDSEQTRQMLAKKNQDARMLASLQITKQAQSLLDQKNPDYAIRTLERAISLNPAAGKNYYYMAEAWIMKDNAKQALEFNRLAGIYLKEDDAWMQNVLQQKDRIEMMNVD